MKKIIAYACGTVAVLAMTAGSAGAQSNQAGAQPNQENQTRTIPGNEKSVSGTVEAIERSSREVTLRLPDGRYEAVYVPQNVKRFDSLKVGQTITVRGSDSVVLRLKPAGETPVDTETETITRQLTPTGTTGTTANERTVTATIVAIDPNVPSITFSGPHYWTYSSRVQDRDALSNVKVGDRMDITWKEGVAVSVEPEGGRTATTTAPATHPKSAPESTAAGLAAAATAGAPKVTVNEPDRWNVTAFLGPGSGGGLQGNAMQLGVAAGYGWSDRVGFEGEFTYAHQSNSSLIDVSSNSQTYTANVLYHIPYKGWLPYAAFGIGAVHGNADLNVPAGPTGTPFSQSQSSTEFAFDLGAGVKKALSGGVRFRGDFRIFDSGGNLPTLWRFYGGLTFLLNPR